MSADQRSPRGVGDHLILAGLFVPLAGRIGDPDAGIAQCKRDLVPVAALLDVRRVGAGHRTVKPIFRAMGVDPMPDLFHVSIDAGDVDGTAMAITASSAAAAVQRVAAARLEARSQALAVVVAERAEQRPLNAGRVHRLSGMIELLAEF